jgi:hypothetical protein
MRSRPVAVVALVVWTVLVWTTRIGNIWGDEALSTSAKWGRTGLAGSFTLLAAAVAWALWHRTTWLRPAVAALAGWTIAVWVVRAVGITTGDHEAAFIAVHLVLATVSIALSAWSWRSLVQIRRRVSTG